MAIRDLFFNILAKDKTGGAFASVKQNLKGVDGAARTTSDRIRGAASSMKRFGAGASAVSAALVVSFRDVLSLYDQQERAEAKVAQAIRSTGGAAGFTAKELGGLASGLQDVTRFGDEDILANVTGQLLTFTNIAGDEFKRAQAVALDLSTVLEGDLKSASIQLGKALNDPVKGLSALSRSGITFSASQEDVIKKLAETGQVAEAQRLILEELERQYGGQAEAAAQAGLGALDQLGNAWGDVKEEIGGVIGELLPPVVAFVKTLVSGFQALPEPIKKFTVVAGLIAVAVGPVVGVLGLLLTGVLAISAPVLAAGAAIAALTAAVLAFWPELQAAAEWIGDTFEEMTLFEKVFAPVSLAVRALGDIFAAVFPESAAFVSDMVEGVTSLLTGQLGAAFDFVTGKAQQVSDAFFSLYDSVVGNSYVPDLVDGISAHFGRLDGEMVGVATSATDSVDGAFRDLSSSVTDSLSELATTGKASFSGFADSILDIGARMVDGLINDVFSQLSQGAGDALNRALNPTVGPLQPVQGGLGGALSGLVSGFIGGFANGGDFTVGGAGGLDRNLVSMNLTRGERVQVTPAGEASGRAPVTVNIYARDVESFRASRGQVAAQIARAAGRGQRNL